MINGKDNTLFAQASKAVANLLSEVFASAELSMAA